MEDEMKKIVVTGDVTKDHFIAIGNRPNSDSSLKNTGSLYTLEKGGAYLIYIFLKEFSNSSEIEVIFGLNDTLFAKLPPKNHSYSTISSQNDEEKKWRIDRLLGFGSASKSDKVDYFEAKAMKDMSDFAIVCIDDAGMDFSSLVNKDCAWPELQTLNKPKDNKKGVELVVCKKVAT
jgi:hypothetical protein